MHEIKNKKITADPLIEYVISSGIIHHLALHLLMYPGFSQKWKRVGSEEDVLNEWKSMRSTYQSGANQHMSNICTEQFVVSHTPPQKDVTNVAV